MTAFRPSALLLPWLLLAAVGCGGSPPHPPELGEPLPELRADEVARFREGEALFNRVFTPAEGVGPLFNENQCSACHTDPVSGGTGEQLVLKATRREAGGSCHLLREEGGENVRRRATPLLRAHGIEREPVPAHATERGTFSVPFLFGLGLVEAVPAREVLARSDPEDADGDGISGRPAWSVTGRLGRFGRKADVPTLREFVVTALLFEMGITSPDAPRERGLVGRPLPPGSDPAPDPEVDAAVVERLTDYVRFLAAPARALPREAEEREQVARGERLFHEVGCSRCHVPEMRTGSSPVPALHRKRVGLYSDLLLHDMGAELADVCGATATPAELRTGILMGLRHRRVFLHDNRANNVMEAILRHGGEASAVRAAFMARDRLEQEDLLRFLDTL